MGKDLFKIVVTEEMEGRRLDQILALQVSRRKARRLLAAGAVFVDGKRIKVASRRPRAGAVVRAPFDLKRAPPPLKWEQALLFRTPHFAVVQKPTKWPSAPTPYGEKGTLSHELQNHLGCEVFVVQRLDAHTSGLLLFGLSPKGAREITQAFMRREIEKEYVALVERGALPLGMIEAPLAPDTEQAGRYVVAPTGRSARTEILCVEPFSQEFQRVTLRLHTGRTHQIRVHLTHLGFPILGDQWYGGRPARRLFLHSHTLRIKSETLGNHRFVSELPHGFRAPEGTGTL